MATSMLQRKQIPPAQHLLAEPGPSSKTHARKQQRLMLTALGLLVIALVSVLYHDRDFWFPDQQDVQVQAESKPSLPVVAKAEPQKLPSAAPKVKTHRRLLAQTSVAHPSSAQPPVVQDPPPAVTTVRTVLPPLNVEVIAGDSHRTISPGSNSVQVDLQRGAAASRATSSLPAQTEPQHANVIKAAERVEVSANAASLVTHSVTPAYPTLARQMKVQGSVILQAIISRDGLIEELRLVSGPPILARAAQEAVRQWHFKPHYVGAEPVETQANITVNFTISTN